MSLNEWHKKGWITKHQAGREEIRNLWALARRDLKDCRTSGLSPDWRMNIAYNAALQSAVAALAASGYRPGREAKHIRVIYSLEHTIRADKHVIAQLDGFRKKRHISDYELAGAVSEQEVKEMIALAEKLFSDLGNWLKKNYPGMVSKK